MNFKDLSKPSLFNRFVEKLKCRVVAIHVPHLDEELIFEGRLLQPFESFNRLARRFIQMDMETCVDAALRGRQQISNRSFNRDEGQFWRCEKLFFSDPFRLAI